MSDYNSILTAAINDEEKLNDFIAYIKENPNETECTAGVEELIFTYGYRKPLFPLIAALWLTVPNGTKIFARHKNMFIKVVNKADNASAFFIALAKELLQSHYQSFAEMKKHTYLMLNHSLDVECEPDDNIVNWLAYTIHVQDWKTLSLDRVLNFEGSKDAEDWLTKSKTNFIDEDFDPHST